MKNLSSQPAHPSNEPVTNPGTDSAIVEGSEQKRKRKRKRKKRNPSDQTSAPASISVKTTETGATSFAPRVESVAKPTAEVSTPSPTNPPAPAKPVSGSLHVGQSIKFE